MQSISCGLPEITVKELPSRNLDDPVIERRCLEIIQNSEANDRIEIINGLREGNITRALNGEQVGTNVKQGSPVQSAGLPHFS